MSSLRRVHFTKSLLSFLSAWAPVIPACLVGAGLTQAARGDFVPSTLKPPPPLREFRAAWIATVKNIDWPSRPGLGAAQQKAELVAILDRAAKLRLNAVILQVRPSCDAFYASSLEPWSEYLTGKMGQAPSPYYDPLAFAVNEAHERGLELHAWFNPYRARHESAISPAARSHITQTQPKLVKSYGKALWLDPAEKAVQDHAIRVILDVVRRYDVDGVHLDDYFYPYVVKDSAGRQVDFPDWTSWKRYTTGGGTMTREDWRRANVDGFVEQLYRAIKAEKAAVKFGISPFGIWRPGNPATIKGMDAYDRIFADSRKWLVNGWVDYLSPQLYWRIDPPEQSYPVLLRWWAEQNVRQRHLWPGLTVARVGPDWPPQETVNQVQLTRRQVGATGNIHWNMRSLMSNRAGVSDLLLQSVYASPALVPASPWLNQSPPATPRLQATSSVTTSAVKANWESGGTAAFLWVLQTRREQEWTTEILSRRETSRSFDSRSRPEAIAVTAIDRFGNASLPAVIKQESAGAAGK